MEYKRVIFIDPGTTFGWAVKGDWIESGAVTLLEEPGPRAYAFWNEIGRLALPTMNNVVLNKPTVPTLIVWEEAASMHRADARTYGVWEGLLLLFCEMHKISCTIVNVQTIKAYAHEQGYFTRRKPKPQRRKGEKLYDWKHRVDLWADIPFDRKPRPRPGWNLSSDKSDETDARWGLEYVLTKLASEKNDATTNT